jgi:NADH-quinone oxidoreductase subunit G/[NiFe] hydrogenase diaphorase moiety small subunit/NADP-reducing hydrogenase subunit HndD
MAEKNITVYIDGIETQVPEGTTILQAAKKVGIRIPTLCYHDDLCIAGNCRVCVVEIEGRPRLEAACATPVEEGMHIQTHSPKVRRARQDVIALLVSEHNTQCTTCYRSTNCELQTLASEYNIDHERYLSVLKVPYEIDKSSLSIEKDPSKCVRCQRCVRTCEELQGVNALTVANRGEDMIITTFMDSPMAEVVCTNCGQCVNHCPTGALTERRYFNEVWEAIGDPDKYVIINTAPSVRVALGEPFGYEPGTVVTGKMVTALRRLGFDAVLDTNFTADLTIVEEASELVLRLKKKFQDGEDVALPMLTSCSPGWVKYLEHMYPELIPNLSTCKSPQQMFGALAKTYYAQKKGIDPAKIVCVAGMPCAAKKFEANRPEMRDSGYQDIDYGLTTREIAQMIKQAGFDLKELPESDFDDLMGESTGAGQIFGATGGVMEAALRTAYFFITGRHVPFPHLDITPVRGLGSVKEVTIKFENVKPEYKFLEGVEAKFAVAQGLKNAKLICEQIKRGESPYIFIEVMACPGGCIGGGGQPIPTNDEIRMKRIQAIYEIDKNKPIRESHENPQIKQLYNEFLKQPLGELSHKLLHTHYRPRNRW